MLPQTVYAYAAGLIDGGGFLRLRALKHGGVSTCVCVGNTDYAMVHWLQENFGGSLVKRTSPSIKSAKPWYVWNLPTSEMEDFLQNTLPYLITKKERALLVLEARKHIRPRHKRGPESTKILIGLVEKMKQLNKMGGVDASDNPL